MVEFISLFVRRFVILSEAKDLCTLPAAQMLPAIT
jgi:hypothetical protein